MCFMPHACSHCSLLFRHRLIPAPWKTSTSTAAYTSTPVFKLCFWCERRENYILLLLLYFKFALVQFALGFKISQIGKQYVLILLVIKNLFTSLVDGVSLVSCNTFFKSTAAFPTSLVLALPFPQCCIGCCGFGKCQNCLCLCCWYIQMFDGIITI